LAIVGVGRTALNVGLHMLCEKPLSLNPGDWPVVSSTAEARDLVLHVGFWRRSSRAVLIGQAVQQAALSANSVKVVA
jgi:predicted dehydrogenase